MRVCDCCGKRVPGCRCNTPHHLLVCMRSENLPSDCDGNTFNESDPEGVLLIERAELLTISIDRSPQPTEALALAESTADPYPPLTYNDIMKLKKQRQAKQSKGAKQ